MGRARWRGLWAIAHALLAVACTTSENQLFTPFLPTAGGGAAGSAGDGGSSKTDGGAPDDSGPILLVNPGLDPDASFVWKQTLPGKGRCETGSYTSSFICRSARSGDRIDGSLHFELVGSSEAPSLTIGDSAVIGFAGGGSQGQAFTAGLQGELSCVSRQLTATTRDERTFPLPVGFDDSSFFGPDFGAVELTGALDGVLDGDALVIMGEIVLVSEAGEVCRGSFSAGRSR